MLVSLFGLDEEVEVAESEITEYATECGDVYEEAYQLADGRWIAFNEAVCAWVMLG